MAGGIVHAVDPHTPDSMQQLMPSAGAGGSLPPLDPDPSQAFLRNLERFGVRDCVIYHRAPSVEVAARWRGERVRLLYIDGLHTYDAVRDDYNAWKPFLADEHVVLFDDYLWEAVGRAVDDLRPQAASRFFYVRGGHAIFSTTRLATCIIGLP
ncbi:MAG: class I SAM-dependent methyltransferase [Actinobacteria bacterium]|nr:MAG: class I SAM-dependent methyltransferase [Actinomycetota bacterium]